MASLWDRIRGRRDYSDTELRQIASAFSQKSALWAANLGRTTQGNPQRDNRDPSQYAHEAYKLNSVSYACIQRIAKTFGTIKWQVVTDTDEPQPIKNHPLELVLKRPNSQVQGVAFFEAYCVNYWLVGDSYIDATVFAKNITELWLPKPFRVEVVPGKFGTPERYKHTVNAGIDNWWFDPVTGEPDLARSNDHMLMHSRTANPTADSGADWYGMSPVEAAAYAIDQHNQASLHNKSLLDNGMTPSGAFAYRPPDDSGLEATMSTASHNRLKTMIKELQQGASNAGSNLILEGYIEYVQMGISPKDGDFNETKLAVAREICNVFGVPFILVVPGQSTYNNVKEARLELAKETVIPFATRFASDFSEFVQHVYPGVRIQPDLLSIPAIRENAIDQAIKVEAVKHWTINEKRRAGGLFITDVDGGDEVLVQAGLLPLSFDLDDDETGSGHEDDDDES